MLGADDGEGEIDMPCKVCGTKVGPQESDVCDLCATETELLEAQERIEKLEAERDEARGCIADLMLALKSLLTHPGLSQFDIDTGDDVPCDCRMCEDVRRVLEICDGKQNS